MTYRRFCLAALAAIASISATAADSPDAYRIHLAVRPVPGTSVQRIALPGPVLAALQRGDLGDLRVFDANGRSMPIALAPSGPPARVQRRAVFAAYPILGSPGALRITGLSLTFDGDRGARLVGADGAVADGGAQSATVLGVLLDTRKVTAPATGLQLDADLPASTLRIGLPLPKR